MPTDPLIQTVTRWWNELTALAGDRLDLLARLRKLLEQYLKTTEQEARARIVVAIEDLLDRVAPDLLEYLERQMVFQKGQESFDRGDATSVLAQIRAILSESVDREPTVTVRSDTPARPHTGHEPLGVEREPAVRVTRYTDITAPGRLTVGQRGVITVGLTRAPMADSAATQGLAVQVGEVEVHLLADSADFEVVGKVVKPLQVLEKEDAEPVVFFVIARSLGAKSLRIDFRQGGVLVGTAGLVIAVVKQAVPDAPQQHVAATVGMETGSTASPDLDLRVVTTARAGGIVLNYVLHSPNGEAGYHYQAFPEVYIPHFASTLALQKQLRETLEMLEEGKDAGGFPLTPRQIEGKLASLGRGLYAQLFPPELRAAYRGFRSKVRTFQITSDEPWIPWELVRPYDDSDPGQPIDDDFLCMRFQLTRWLAGPCGGAGQIKVDRLVCVEAGQVSGQRVLTHAAAERACLAAFADRLAAADESPDPVKLAAVEELLDAGGIGLWHFVAHGHQEPDRPDEAMIVLPDGVLRAEDIHGPRQTHIKVDRPLIFLNACRVGSSGWVLSGLGGWAARLVGEGRCGAFIAPQWAVNDGLAQAFAKTFYEALQEEQTIGQAAQAARQRIHDQAPTDPTWLAYSVYAHPNARVGTG